MKIKDYGKPIAQPALEAVVGKDYGSYLKSIPRKKMRVLNKFTNLSLKSHTEKIGPADIRTAEQGQFLTLLINEIDSTSMTQEEAEFAGKQVLDQLHERKLDRHKDYNRNIFTVRTDDQLAEKIRTYCKDNDVPPNQLIKTVLQNYFNDELKTTI